MELGDVILETIKKLINDFTDEEIEKMRKTLKSKDKLATGHLYNSIKKDVLNDYNVRIRVAKYGKFVNSGRRPGAKMPPREAIEKWMMTKGIPIEYSFPIRKKIAEEGIIKVPFLDMYDTDVKKFQDELLKSLGPVILKQIQIELTQVFTEVKGAFTIISAK